MKKGLLCSIVSLGILMASTTTVFAGTWKYNKFKYGGYEWQYLKDNGAYAEHEWIYDNGSWYYIGNTKAMCTKISVKSGNDEYYVGADGKMIKGGFAQRDTTSRLFADKDGKLISGLFMVDGILYEAGGLTGNLIFDNRYTARYKFQGVDGKEHTLNYIYDGGKVLELDGNPIKSDDKFYQLIKYIPKYDSKGNFLGAIQN